MLSNADRAILRRLCDAKARAAESPENRERREAWYRHDAGQGGRPMILAEFEGVRDSVLPVPETALECRDDWARRVEKSLRFELYRFEVLRDDHVIEPWMQVSWKTEQGDYGVQAVVHSGDRDGHMGARRWDPPVTDLDRDFAKLHFRELGVDREGTSEETALMEETVGDILPVRIRGSHYWTMGLTWKAIDLIGLEGLMLSMYDNPDGLHRLMGFLRDDHLNLSAKLEVEGLYTLNNENDYIGSGSMGYSRELGNGGKVGEADLWVLSESQETVGVSPELFEEFVFPYQIEIVKRFGRCYYGCCEPVNARIGILKRLPNLARVSVSPWADEEVMAEECGTEIVYSRKPNPTLVSTKVFDEPLIRADLRKTCDTASGCRLEIIMKDVHTLNGEPGRLARWVEIAREETGRSS